MWTQLQHLIKRKQTVVASILTQRYRPHIRTIAVTLTEKSTLSQPAAALRLFMPLCEQQCAEVMALRCVTRYQLGVLAGYMVASFKPCRGRIIFDWLRSNAVKNHDANTSIT